MNLLKRIYIFIRHLYQNLLWWQQFSEVKKRYRRISINFEKNEILPISKYNNILIVVPHADDDIIGNFGVLKFAKKVSLYHVGHYPINDAKLTAERTKELGNLAKIFNASLLEVESSDHISNIKQILQSSQFDAVFTPCPFDWHPDHQNATRYLMLASMDLGNKTDIYMYSVTVPFPIRANCSIIPLTRSLQIEKWNWFKRIYSSQLFMPVLRFKLHERLNGVRTSNAYSAETYIKVSLAELNHYIINSPGTEQRDLIYSRINNIKKIKQLRDF